jgi:hypothetical protein
MVFVLWVLACDSEIELPEREFTALEAVALGPCSCPGVPPAVKAELTRHDRDKVTPVTMVRVDDQCRVLSIEDPAPPTKLSLSSPHSGAVGLNDPPNTIECPDHTGTLHFWQGQASCPTTFHNAAGVGPTRFKLIPGYWEPRAVEVSDGETRPLDCDRAFDPYAPGWRLTGETSKVVEGSTQITLSWEEAPTLAIRLLDTAGGPVAGIILTDLLGPRVVTDEEGRAAYGRRRGPVSLVGRGPEPIVTLHLEDGAEHEIETYVHPAITVQYADERRTPLCALGPSWGCRPQDIQSLSLCRCKADDKGQIPLVWSAGLVTVPAGVEHISLDVSVFSAQVYGELEGQLPDLVRLRAIEAPDPSLDDSHWGKATNSHGLVFENVAPGRYQVETIGFSSQVLAEVEVLDKAVDLGTLTVNED